MIRSGFLNCKRPFVTPSLQQLGKHQEIALIEIGNLDDKALSSLTATATELESDTDVSTVVLSIDCHHAEFTPSALLLAAVALWRLRLTKLLVCHINSAIGLPAYALAATGSIVVASPTASIGVFGCISGDELDENIRVALETQLTEYRPQIHAAALHECANHTLSGEAAESCWARLVDGLCDTPENFLAALFPNNQGPLLQVVAQ